MKRIVKIILLVFIMMFMFSINPKALDIDAFGYVNKTSIKPNTYIIGKHVFDNNRTSQGVTLTMKAIMNAANTIEGGEYDDMIIYYYSPAGQWRDETTGQILNTVPSRFNVSKINNKDI